MESRQRLIAFAAVVLAMLGALAAGGFWAHAKMRTSLKEIRAAGLSSLLEAQTGAVQLWIGEKKADAERWASSPSVQRVATDMVAMAARGVAPAAICASPQHRALMQEIAPFVRIEEAVTFNLTLPEGRIVASNQDAYCGRRIASAEFLERMAPAFKGRTVFIRPFLEADRVPEVSPALFDRPLVWVKTPVHGADGQVVAVLGFGRFAEDRFGRLLALTVAHTTREAYAFDRRGFILTESRYLEALRKAGLVEAGGTGILHLQLRDPGGDIAAGFRPEAPVAERPFSRIVEAALESRAAGEESGAELEPYRNYRGASVIGAWRWLPEKEMAIAAEIEAGEAFAPLRYLQLAFGGLFAFLLAALAVAGASSVWAMRLRLREARRMGQYTLEREIGEGGMSRVYLARHSQLKRPTAVKVLKTAIANDEVVTRFEREVQLCSQLSHPNTIEIYDYGRTRDGTFYYAMEYLTGISLEDLVRLDGPLPAARAVHALRQVCGSLQEAHQRGLVHRDVKPQNLMLCVRGALFDVVKVLDFGLVKEMRNPHTRDITQFAKVLGTPLYMAPERLRNPADADARADIYSIGAVAYFIVTGKHAFRAETDHDQVYRILNDTAPTLAAGGAPDAPPELEALVARCLAKEREARPQSVEEVGAALAEIALRHPWTEEEARRWWTTRGVELGITPAARGEERLTA